jgi:hypothetical protein
VIAVTLPAEPTRIALQGMRQVAAATEVVESYCTDYLDAEGRVDLESLGHERVDHVMRTLAELDALVDGLTPDTTYVPRAVFEYVLRTADELRRAIREALTQKTPPSAEDIAAAQVASRHALTRMETARRTAAGQ